MEEKNLSNSDVAIETAVKKKTSAPVIVVSVAMVVIVVAIIVAVVLFAKSSGEKRRIADQLALGDRYLSELDYDQAIAAYRAVIEIDPKNKEAYENFVDTYIAWSDATATDGDPDESIKLLENAVSELETLRSEDNNEIIDEQMQRLLNRLEELRGKTPESGGAMSPADELLEQGEYDSALEMYLSILEEDPMDANAYLGIVEVYLRKGDYETALKYAQEGYDKTGDERLLEMIDMIESGNIFDSRGNCLKMISYGDNGNIEYWHEYTYDKDGILNSVTSFDANGNQTSHLDLISTDDYRVSYGYNVGTGIVTKEEIYIDNNGRDQKVISYDEDGNIESYTEFEYAGNSDNVISAKRYDNNYAIKNIWEYAYDNEGREIEEHKIEYDDNGSITYESYVITEYDSEGRVTKEAYLDSNRNVEGYTTSEYSDNVKVKYTYDGDGNLREKAEFKYDDNGNWLSTTEYDADGNIVGKTEYQ